MENIGDLQKRIKALEDAGLDATAEKAQLAQLVAVGPAPVPPLATPTSAGSDEVIAFDEDVDQDAFESGGQGFSAPTDPGVYNGIFQGIIVPSTKPEQRWFIFKTDDPRVEAQKGSQVRSAIIVTPGGAGAFKLKDILDNLKIPYTQVGKRVKFTLAKGLPCQLEYEEQTYDGKTQNRLQNVYPVGSVETAI